METLRNANEEEIRRLVNQHNDAVLLLLQEFANQNMSEFNEVQVYQRSDDFGWLVSGTLTKKSSPSTFIWLHILPNKSCIHIHMNTDVEGVGGGTFLKLAHALYEVIKIPVYVYPPKIFGRWNAVREKIEDKQEPQVETSIIMIGASLSISTVAMTQLLGRNDYSLALYFALGCFAVSIPFLTLVAIMLLSSKIYSTMLLPNLRVFVAGIGNFATVLGIVFLFFHYHWLIGTTFIVFIFIALAISVVYAEGLLLIQEFWAEVSAPHDDD